MNKELKANKLYDAYKELNEAAKDLTLFLQDKTIEPILNDVIKLRNSIKREYDKTVKELDK